MLCIKMFLFFSLLVCASLKPMEKCSAITAIPFDVSRATRFKTIATEFKNKGLANVIISFEETCSVTSDDKSTEHIKLYDSSFYLQPQKTHMQKIMRSGSDLEDMFHDIKVIISRANASFKFCTIEHVSDGSIVPTATEQWQCAAALKTVRASRDRYVMENNGIRVTMRISKEHTFAREVLDIIIRYNHKVCTT